MIKYRKINKNVYQLVDSIDKQVLFVNESTFIVLKEICNITEEIKSVFVKLRPYNNYYDNIKIIFKEDEDLIKELFIDGEYKKISHLNENLFCYIKFNKNVLENSCILLSNADLIGCTYYGLRLLLGKMKGESSVELRNLIISNTGQHTFLIYKDMNIIKFSGVHFAIDFDSVFEELCAEDLIFENCYADGDSFRNMFRGAHLNNVALDLSWINIIDSCELHFNMMFSFAFLESVTFGNKIIDISKQSSCLSSMYYGAKIDNIDMSAFHYHSNYLIKGVNIILNASIKILDIRYLDMDNCEFYTAKNVEECYVSEATMESILHYNANHQPKFETRFHVCDRNGNVIKDIDLK